MKPVRIDPEKAEAAVQAALDEQTREARDISPKPKVAQVTLRAALGEQAKEARVITPRKTVWSEEWECDFWAFYEDKQGDQDDRKR